MEEQLYYVKFTKPSRPDPYYVAEDDETLLYDPIFRGLKLGIGYPRKKGLKFSHYEANKLAEVLEILGCTVEIIPA